MRPPRYAGALVATGLLALLPLTSHAAVTSPGDPADPGDAAGRGGAAPTRTSAAPAASDEEHQHSSDGVVGEIAPSVPPAARGRVTSRALRSWQVAPGVTARSWERTDYRGAVRYHLVRVDPDEPGVRLDYARRGRVRNTAPLTRILAADEAVAGINGDFFDISRTGAPLGTGLDLDRGLLHARVQYWNESFYLRGNGSPAIGTLPMRTTISEHPDVRVTNYNAPWVMPDGLGVYTRAFGAQPGYDATQGQRSDIRVVTVRDGRVTSRATSLPTSGRVRGTMLVGRGPGAAALDPFTVGSRVTVEPGVAGRAGMAITGDAVLLARGRVQVTDDREMHPRTAVGIDQDTGDVLLLAVDGRQDFSRGQTMVELARTMQRLGAEKALNLDGGGSTTMVARRSDGSTSVVNSPSDGAQRPVANALEVTYR